MEAVLAVEDPRAATAEDKALLMARLESHIREVAGHYGGDIGE